MPALHADPSGITTLPSHFPHPFCEGQPCGGTWSYPGPAGAERLLSQTATQASRAASFLWFWSLMRDFPQLRVPMIAGPSGKRKKALGHAGWFYFWRPPSLQKFSKEGLLPLVPYTADSLPKGCSRSSRVCYKHRAANFSADSLQSVQTILPGTCFLG